MRTPPEPPGERGSRPSDPGAPPADPEPTPPADPASTSPVRRRFYQNPLLTERVFLLVCAGVALVVFLAVLQPQWIGQADYRANVRGSGVQFGVSQFQELLGTRPLRPLSATLEGLDSLELPSGEFRGIDRLELSGVEDLRQGRSPAAPACNVPRPAPEPASGLQFGELGLEPGSTVQIVRSETDGGLELYLLAGTWRGSVWLDSVRVQVLGRQTHDALYCRAEGTPQGLGPQLTFGATRENATADAPRIRLRGGAVWTLADNMSTRDLSFWIGDQGGRSLIEGGTIRVIERVGRQAVGGETIELLEGDRISFDRDSGLLTRVEVGEIISLRASGVAKNVALEGASLRLPPLVRLYRLDALRILLVVLAGALSMWAGWSAVFARRR